MTSTALSINEVFDGIFQDYRGCSVAKDELAHDWATAISQAEEKALAADKAEQLAEVIDLADHLLNGGKRETILDDGTRLSYDRDDISVRVFEHDLFPKAIANFTLKHPDAGIVLQDLSLRCAREVAADALGYDLDELFQGESHDHQKS